ncbi:glucose transport transcription regulator RGT1 [Staphylotrichum tortipilum]|uniref:Glucose transport transcription regulator RGT1 n=1 Tax=Staphylotrichum tortipilum TaxID=2831512 RepID=A0AAN6ML86_9PEZI|nr:glucose transport transcription regulator RGT1 [Staphylotrichum longicolle]
MDEEDKKPPPEPQEAAMLHSYPSPMVDSTEAQYYEQLAQHRELDPQMDHQGPPPEHQEHQEQHDHELHQLQGLQESPAPQRQSSGPPVSADELQLAAQLTQGLAPMMMAAPQDQPQEQQSIPQQDGQAGQGQAQAEPNLQEQLEASLQNHERELQSHAHELQEHGHQLQDHDLHHGLPSHADQSQAHHYPQTAQQQPHLPHHLSMEHMPNAQQQQYQVNDATPPRKRSKVSRACDECRRKKIKCDAQSVDATEQPCSNCRRSNAQCLFSRVPQKRGPSKGYIKELADRINTIEGKLNTNVDGLERSASNEAFAPPALPDDSRKRPFSSISADGFQTPSPNRVSAPYAPDHRPIYRLLQPDFRAPNSGDPAELAIKPVEAIQFPIQTADIGLQSQPDMMDGIAQNGLPQGPVHQADQMPEIEDAAFNRYLEVIHPTFPVLASTKARVQSLLWQSPGVLQNAFYSAFDTLVNSFRPDAGGEADDGTATACRLLSEWEAESKPRSAVTDLVRLQTLVLVVMAADCLSMASAKNLAGGPSKSEILGRAIGLGLSMRLYLREVDSEPGPDFDPNSDDNVALRAWWVLVMLDRWHAVGSAMPLMFGNDSFVDQPGLTHITGDAVFWLIRISYVLGHTLPLTITPEIDPLSKTGAALLSLGNASTQMLRWVFPAGRTDPVLHLAYWHARLLTELLSPDRRQRPLNILQATRNIVRLLADNQEMLSPLTHHFMCLAALGLVELGRFGETRRESAGLVEDVLGYSMARSAWSGAVRNRLAELLPGEKVAAGPNLQQLAELATAVDGSVVTAAAAGPAGTAEDGFRDVEDGNAAAGAHAETTGAQQQTVPGEEESDGEDIPVEEVRVDVREVLRGGYLSFF